MVQRKVQHHYWLIKQVCHRCRLTAQTNAGFTLLEILISTMILGILAALAFPNMLATVDKARYAEAKSQMGCLARELKGFRLENGYFPADRHRDIRPQGIECFNTQASGKVPFDSKYDYDYQGNSSNCYVQIIFLGKNGEKEAPSNSATYPQPGIYDYSDINSNSDDLVYSLGTNPSGPNC